MVSTYLGGDGYRETLAAINGRLRDYSPAGLDAERAFYRSIRDELGRIDRERLGLADRIDYDVLGAQLAFLLHQLEDLHTDRRAVDTYVAEPFRGVDWQIQGMSPGARPGERGTDPEWELVVGRLEAVPGYLRVAEADLRAGKAAGTPPDRRLVQRDGSRGASPTRSTSARPYRRRPSGPSDPGALRDRSARGSAGPGPPPPPPRRTRSSPRSCERPSTRATAPTGTLGEKEYDWRLRHRLNVRRRAAELWDYGAEQVALYQRQIYQVAKAVAGEARLALRFGSAAERQAAVRRVLDHLAKEGRATTTSCSTGTARPPIARWPTGGSSGSSTCRRCTAWKSIPPRPCSGARSTPPTIPRRR